MVDVGCGNVSCIRPWIKVCMVSSVLSSSRVFHHTLCHAPTPELGEGCSCGFKLQRRSWFSHPERCSRMERSCLLFERGACVSDPELVSHAWKLLLNGVRLKTSCSLAHCEGSCSRRAVRLDTDHTEDGFRSRSRRLRGSGADPSSAVASGSRLRFAFLLTWERDPSSSGMRLSLSAEVSLIQLRNVDNEKGQANAVSSPLSTFIFLLRCSAACMCWVNVKNCKSSCFPFPHCSGMLV